MQRHVVPAALLLVILIVTCDMSNGQQATKKSPPVALDKQQQQQAMASPPSNTKPFTKVNAPSTAGAKSSNSVAGQQEQAQLYECVMCSKPAAGVVRAAAASASAQQAAVAALQAAGIQVTQLVSFWHVHYLDCNVREAFCLVLLPFSAQLLLVVPACCRCCIMPPQTQSVCSWQAGPPP
jgi:hypothetical protein